jgi:peptidoglycan/LPS O-acetylase OafA/YrhL
LTAHPTVPVGFARYQTLDAWRGVACLMVIVYHSTLVHAGTPGLPRDVGVTGALLWLASYGNLGVPIFFVISGYCISAAADRARRHGHPARTYFLRRFRRIYPPLWAVIAGLILFFLVVDYVAWPGLLSSLPWQQPRPWWLSGWQWAGNLTLTETWRHYFVGGPRAHFPGQAWTLCYEEQFYAITGLLLWTVPARFFLGSILVTLASAAMLGVHAAFDVPVRGFFFDGSWFMFAAGMAVYYVITQRVEWRMRAIAVLVSAGLALWLFVDIQIGVAVTFAGMLLVLHRFDTQLLAWRTVRGLGWCGTMCYSLYLVHQTPVKAVSAALHVWGFQSGLATLTVVMPACVVVSLLFGRLFFKTVESRFLNFPLSISGTRQRAERPGTFPSDVKVTSTI